MKFFHPQKLPSPNHSDFNQSLLVELDALYRTARYLLGDSTLAEDIVQETVFKAIHRQETFHSNGCDGNFRPWIFAILRNTITDHYRTKKTTISLDDSDLDVVDDISIEKDYFEQVMDEEIVNALSELPEDMKLAVLLADVEGFSYDEIAATLHWPPGSVMSRLYRGRQKLRSSLCEYAKRKGYTL